MGDFNGDGNTDLVTSNFNSFNVSLLLGNGDGTFAAASNFAVVDRPESVTVGDFNGDGNTDLVTANAADTVSLLLGNGDGTFVAAANFAVGGRPLSVTAGDFNGDGQTDLATANSGSDNVSLLLGNGNGTFAAQANFAVGDRPTSVTMGDFNGDGQTDLVTANYSSNNVSLLLGNGDGTFAAASNFAIGSGSYSVTVGDFNGDGQTDLATANYGSSNVSVLLNTTVLDHTLPSFVAQPVAAVGSRPNSVTKGDFNGDGKTDLVTANSNSKNVSVLLGNGDGTFAAAANFAVGTYPFSVTVGDFNGDGNTDLATANFGSNNVSLLLGNGDGTFAAAANVAVGSYPGSVTVGDFNGDGQADLVTANGGSNHVSLLLGNGDGTFAAAANFAVGSDPESVAVGDFNGDGNTDLVTANYVSNNVSLLLGNGDGTFAAAANVAVGSGPFSVAVGDFNGDGKSDLVTANRYSLNVSLLLGNGDGNFAAAANFAVGSDPFSVAVGDFNGDGRTDLVTANYNSDNVSVLLNTPAVQIIDNGDAGFATPDGVWNAQSGKGHAGDIVYNSTPNGGALDTATWTFTGLVAGSYRVSATWKGQGNLATNAAYTILDGASQVGAVSINQTTDPNDFSDAGSTWEDLGGLYTINGGTLVVQLSDQGANNYLFADAVRIELVTPPPAVQIIDNGDAGFATPDGVWLAQAGKGHAGDILYNSTPNGGALDTATWTFTGLAVGTYRVSATWKAQNNLATNAAYTILDGASQVGAVSINQAAGPDDFSDSGSTWEDLGGLYTISAGTLFVQLSDLGANNYLFADAVRIELVTPPPAVQIIDNGDAGFATPDGVWNAQSGKGHAGDIVYNSTPNGGALDTATWTFTGLAVGSYRVSATWKAQGNLATNAAYTILDGASQVGAVSINQTTDPNDFSDDGSTWEDLGGIYTISGGTLVVQLSDLGANNYVFADAVRIELLPPPPAVQIIDNGDAGFATPDGVWLAQAGKGHEGDIVYNSTPNGGALDTATWTFTGLAVGSYRVSATWKAQGNLATNASYTILDGASQVGAVSINQTTDPNDFSDAGSTWENLGGLYTINGGTLVVQLSDQGANNYLYADAVRIELVLSINTEAPAASAVASPPASPNASLVLSAPPSSETEKNEEHLKQQNLASRAVAVSDSSSSSGETVSSSDESTQQSDQQSQNIGSNPTGEFEAFGDSSLLDLLYQM